MRCVVVRYDAMRAVLYDTLAEWFCCHSPPVEGTNVERANILPVGRNNRRIPESDRTGGKSQLFEISQIAGERASERA